MGAALLALCFSAGAMMAQPTLAPVAPVPAAVREGVRQPADVQARSHSRRLSAGERAMAGLTLCSGGGHNAGSGNGCFPPRGRRRGSGTPAHPPHSERSRRDASPSPDPSWVRMVHGDMHAGSPLSGTTPRAFVDQMVGDNTWAHSVPIDVRRAIASAIDRQCSPWFIDYEHWRAHVADFCWRSSRAHMRATERYDSHLADLLAEINEARRERAELTSRIAVLERQLDEAVLPPEDRDSALLPTTERIDRAQRRAAQGPRRHGGHGAESHRHGHG